MDDEKKDKPDKLFLDEKTGILHAPQCPRTKKEFGEGGDGKCALEAFLKEEQEEIRKTIPYKPDTATSGPVQVATPAYREGYDRIFGTKPPVGQA